MPLRVHDRRKKGLLDYDHRFLPKYHVFFSTQRDFKQKFWYGGVDLPHGLVNYKDAKTKCGHLKELTCNVMSTGAAWQILNHERWAVAVID